jgi:hypothetical protein
MGSAFPESAQADDALLHDLRALRNILIGMFTALVAARLATREELLQQTAAITGGRLAASTAIRCGNIAEHLFDMGAATHPAGLATLVARHASAHTP